ncbi:hypothetical protein N182_21245 [Sinorhizobium sp. GL2]|nr:hypothetical protein N182_21245 [Sinorhizobium sp. GL2]
MFEKENAMAEDRWEREERYGRDLEKAKQTAPWNESVVISLPSRITRCWLDQPVKRQRFCEIIGLDLGQVQHIRLL